MVFFVYAILREKEREMSIYIYTMWVRSACHRLMNRTLKESVCMKELSQHMRWFCVSEIQNNLGVAKTQK